MQINIEKKHAFMILGAIFILSGVILVYAFGTNNPPVFGHSPGEIAPGTFNGTGSSDWIFPGRVRPTMLCLSGTCRDKWYSFDYPVDIFLLPGGTDMENKTNIGSRLNDFCVLQNVQIGQEGSNYQEAGCQIAYDGLEVQLRAYRSQSTQKVYCRAICMPVLL
ncbi:hypothetical protein COU60_03225 [Candidatus Pacearchaeota archaeon CG10_big_fil_rev_8_21_14_0_10_34_76]|nr:MAG: hypothetical protein COU60_03225 [Candidatus Pacearchaeota archaeon CG10_big_fil_rev_8_21_14_0_10_34_76]